MFLQHLGDRGNAGRQHPAPMRVTFREAKPAATGCGGGPDRQVLAFGQGDRFVPAAGRVNVGSGHEDRVLCLLEAGGEVGDHGRVGARSSDHRPVDHMLCLGGVHLDIPVVHRNRNDDRSHRRKRREVNRVGNRQRHVFGAGRFVGVLDEGVPDADRVAVGQVRLHRDLGANLLADRDHHRRVVGLRVEERADRVAEARSGVEVDQGRLSGDLGVTVGHAHHGRLLQAQHVLEVIGVIGQHRQLGRARVTEDRGHPQLAEKVEGRFANGRHGRSLYVNG